MLHECDVPPDVEEVHDGQRLVHAHQRLRVRRNRPADERKMRRVRELVAIDDEAKRAVRRRERPLGDALDQPLGAAPMRNEIGNRADLEPVVPREVDEIGKARHGAVGIHDLAQHGGRREPGERREIAACFVWPGAGEHAARLRDERKHMTGLHDVRGLRVGGGGHADRMRPILGRDTGGHALRRFDRDGEVGAVDRTVLRHHRREIEAFGMRRGDRHADEPAAVGRQEIDLLRRHEIRGEDEVALVFAILLVDQHSHPPGLEVGDEIGNGRKTHGAAVKKDVYFTLGGNWPIRAAGGSQGAVRSPGFALARPLTQSRYACPPLSVAFSAQQCHDKRSRPGCQAHAGRGRRSACSIS